MRDLQLFDVYRPQAIKTEAGTALADVPAQKSLAVRLTLASNEATLSDAQVESLLTSVITACERDLPVKLRA